MTIVKWLAPRVCWLRTVLIYPEAMSVIRAGVLGLLALLLTGSLTAQWPKISCKEELKYLPSQPPPPWPPRPPPSCKGVDDLVKAAGSGCVTKVETYLKEGVPLESTDENGRTALVAAAQSGRAEAARMLLDKDADPTKVFRLRSALCWGSGSTDVTRLFLERGLLEKLEDSCAYLEEYSRWGDAELVRELISSGFEVDKRSYRGKTPLVAAVIHRNYRVLQALLEAGADPHATAWGDMRVSMVHVADATMTCLMLKHGADPNVRDRDGETPLMSAAYVGREKRVILLLDGGADPDLQDSSGRTALMHALTGELYLEHGAVRKFEKDEVAIALLKAGADIRIKDKSGKDALAYAEEHGHDEIAAMLREQLNN